MKKLLIYIFAFVSVTMVMPFFSCSAEQAGEVVYSEDFEKGETDIVASAECGSSSIVTEKDGNHVLYMQGNEVGYSMAVFGPNVADFDFTMRIKLSSASGSWGWSKLLFHSDYGEHFSYRLNMYTYCMNVDFNNYAEDNIRIISETQNAKLEADKWYEIKVFARKTKYTVVVNGVRALSFTSDDNEEGGFGFAGWQSEYYVDDISITEYEDNTAPAVDTLIGVDPEKEVQIEENELKMRTMKNSDIIYNVNSSKNSDFKKIIVFLLFGMAFLAVTAAVILILTDKKRKLSKKQQ